MEKFQCIKPLSRIITIFVIMILISGIINAQQKISFGLHADPVISWFSSDINEVENNGARPGFSFGLTFNKFFSPNYSFSTGISIINAGGRLVNTQTTDLQLGKKEYKLATVPAGKSVVYKIQYLTVPLGLKLQTNQIGYITFFSDIGLDPKVVIGGKADIPYLNIEGEPALRELKALNLSYHITGGIEYSLGGNTALILGLNFDNNFLDITKETGDQPKDKVSHKLLSFRIGVNF
jgi:hypothetical protein